MPIIDLEKYINIKPDVKYIFTEDRISMRSSRSSTPSIPRMIELDEYFGFILGNYIERATWGGAGTDRLVFAVFENERIPLSNWFKKYQIVDTDEDIYRPCSVGSLLNVYSPLLLKAIKTMVYYDLKLYLSDSPLEFRLGLIRGLFYQGEYHARKSGGSPSIKCPTSLKNQITTLMDSVGKTYNVERSDTSSYIITI